MKDFLHFLDDLYPSQKEMLDVLGLVCPICQHNFMYYKEMDMMLYCKRCNQDFDFWLVPNEKDQLEQ